MISDEKNQRSMDSVVFLMVILISGVSMASANVVLIGNNVTLSFEDIEANFGELSFVFWIVF